MANDVTFNLELAIKDYNTSLQKANQNMDRFTDSFEKSTKKMNTVWGSFVGNLAANAVTSLVTGIGGLASASIDAAIELEGMSTELGVMLGSAEEGKKALAELQNFAASTPFQLPGIVDASKKLLAFGVTSEDMNDVLTTLGDVSAGTGKPIQDLAIIFGQVKGETKLTLERFNQLADSGINLRGVLADQLGISVTEVKDKISAGKVSFEDFKGAMDDITSDGGVFADGMIKQSQTLGGVMSTLNDVIFNAVGTLGQQLLPVMKNTALGMIDFVKSASEVVMPFFTWFKENSGTLFDTLKIGIPLLTAAWVAFNAQLVITQAAAALAWAATLGPITLVVAGIAAVGVALFQITKHWDDIKNGAKLALAAALDFAGRFSDSAKAQAAELRKQVADDNAARIKAEEENAKKIEEINKTTADKKKTKLTEEKAVRDQASADKLQKQQDESNAALALVVNHQENLALAEEEGRIAMEEARILGVDATEEEKLAKRETDIINIEDHNIKKLDAQVALDIAQAALISDADKREQKLTDIKNKAELGKLKIHNTAKLASEKARNKAEFDASKKLVDDQKILNDKREQDTKNLGTNLMTIGKSSSRDLFELGKSLAQAQATIAGVTAIQLAASALPFPANIPGIVAETARFASTLSTINGQSFANGGVVGGSSFTGDNVGVNVNSREMILNQGQQAQLFQLANNGGGNSAGMIDAINSLGDRISNMEITLVADDNEIARSARRGFESGIEIVRS